MTIISKYTHIALTPRIISRRWLVLLLASIFFHVLLINWSGKSLGVHPRPDQAQKIVTVELKPLPPINKPILVPPPAQPKTTPRSPPKTPPKSQPTTKPFVLDTPIRETVTPIINPDSIHTASEMPVVDIGSMDGSGSTGTALSNTLQLPDIPIVSTEPTVIHYQVKPPPSAILKYDVQALQKGLTYHGSGKITWQINDSSYVINGEAGILFITALDFKSEGEINSLGVAPILYTEKRFRKASTSTHFHRERNIINFSASTNSYARTGGEQDRASIVWQLASIGRGDSTQFVAGGVIDLFVAGTRDAETWRIQVIDKETITVGTGTIEAWHVIRIPQPGSYEQKLDIWLAPQEQWYPVKLRFTEKNGDFLDMALSKLIPLDALSTQF